MDDFTQSDLDEEDVMLLDTWDEVRGQGAKNDQSKVDLWTQCISKLKRPNVNVYICDAVYEGQRLQGEGLNEIV